MPNNNTLHKDIKLMETSNGYWDISFTNGDTDTTTNTHTLRNGLIIACLTSWNYLNRKGNLTYTIFGNKAYEELKKKKSQMVEYKIKQYFIEVLNRIRRVHTINSLEVLEYETDPYAYFVKFTVTSINDELVNGSFTIRTDYNKNNTFIEHKTYMPYASNLNPLTMDVYLKNEHGVGISDEILYTYLKTGQEYEFIGVTYPTDKNGYVRYEYKPKKTNPINTLYFTFQGNTTHNGCESEKTEFKTEIMDYELLFNEKQTHTTTPDNIIGLKLHTITQDEPIVRKPVQDVKIFIKGDDGSTYETETNDYGEAYFNCHIHQNTTFTAYYNKVSDSTNIIIDKTNLNITTLLDKTDTMHTLEQLKVYSTVLDGQNNPMKNFQLDLTIDEDETIKLTPTNENGETEHYLNLQEGQHTINIKNQNNNFYEDYEETFTINVEKYHPTIIITTPVQSIKTGEPVPLTITLNNVPEYISKNIRLNIQDITSYETTTMDVIMQDNTLTIGVELEGVNNTYIINAEISEDEAIQQTQSNNISIKTLEHNYNLHLVPTVIQASPSLRTIYLSNNPITSNITQYIIQYTVELRDFNELLYNFPSENEQIRITCPENNYTLQINEYNPTAKHIMTYNTYEGDNGTIHLDVEWGNITNRHAIGLYNNRTHITPDIVVNENNGTLEGTVTVTFDNNDTVNNGELLIMGFDNGAVWDKQYKELQQNDNGTMEFTMNLLNPSTNQLEHLNGEIKFYYRDPNLQNQPIIKTIRISDLYKSLTERIYDDKTNNIYISGNNSQVTFEDDAITYNSVIETESTSLLTEAENWELSFYVKCTNTSRLGLNIGYIGGGDGCLRISKDVTNYYVSIRTSTTTDTQVYGLSSINLNSTYQKITISSNNNRIGIGWGNSSTTVPNTYDIKPTIGATKWGSGSISIKDVTIREL